MLSHSVRNRFVVETVKRTFKRKLTNNVSSTFIVESGCTDVEIPNVTVPEYLSICYDKYEKFTAVECCVTKRKYTYGEIRSKSTNLAKALRKIFKLENADVVSIILKNHPEYPIADVGVIKANLIASTVSPIYTADEMARQLIDSNTKLVITEVELSPTVKKALDIIKKKLPLVAIKTKQDQSLPENTIDFHQLVNTKVDYPDLKPGNPNDVVFLPYSSGTTGLPKGVQLTHRNIMANMKQSLHDKVNYKIEATDSFQEQFPAVIPLYHVYGHVVIMHDLASYGGKMLTLPGFSIPSFFAMLAEYQNSTVYYVAPPLFLLMIEHVKKEYLKNMRIISNGAAPLASTDEIRFSEKFGNNIKILQGYGLTETSPVVSTLYPNIMENPEVYRGSIGRPMPSTQVKIVDPEDTKNTALGPNATGELLVKGPQVMKGYLNLPEETKNTVTADGWLRTGDAGYFNQHGFLFVVDRFKELIKVRGNQVPPAELEAIIRSFPGVADAAVIGIPDKYSGELPRAYIVEKPGSKVDVTALNAFVSEKVARYKKLEGGVTVVKQIPKNSSGKILRRSLRETYIEKGV